MFETVTASDRTTAEAVAADTSAPKPLRESVRTALERCDRAVDVLTGHRDKLRAARADWQAAEAGALVDVLGALEAGEVPAAGAMGATIRDTLTRVADLETAGPVLRQAARHYLEALRVGAYRANRDAVVKWCASVRSSVPWWEPVPDHVSYAWSACGAAWAVYPSEACAVQRPNGDPVRLPERSGLRIDNPTEREVWMWSAIAAGRVDWRTPTEVRPLDWYHDREPLPHRPERTAAAQPRGAMFARSR